MQQRQGKQSSLVIGMFLLLALAIGLGAGLLVTRVARPPGRAANAFADLEGEAREEYAVLVAAGYRQHHDLPKARAQLERLGIPNAQLWLASLVDRHLAEGRDAAETRALVELADALGVKSQPVLAYLATLTPQATDTPLPTPTPIPTSTPTATPIPPTKAPTALPPTATPSPLPTDTPQPLASDTPEASATPSASPQPTHTSPPKPQPSDTPKPTHTPAAKWSWTARLIGPGQEGQSCAEGHKLIRVTVLDAAGNQIPGVWVHEEYTGWYRVTGHKGEDPYWGPGEVELNNLDGGQVCIATGEGGGCESELTRNLPCHDPPPFEDLWAAGYCECCEPGITKERCQELFESGKCLGISHYAWRVEFKRSW